ncbi:XdhC family protein [Candidatus Pelagibacter sp.]|nr:XdhC family protein [Candidatus Pelagibacter sp.]
MKLKILEEIIQRKNKKNEFSVITNLETGNSKIFLISNPIDQDFADYEEQIKSYYKNKKNGIIKNTNIFIQTFTNPIKVIVVGAVHIAQYIVEFTKNLNFEIILIDPRKFFATEERFPKIKIVNKWPDEAFKKIKTDSNTALISLTHNPKIDDPALIHAIKKRFYYIGALGSQNTHSDRCERLKKLGFDKNEINTIHGPIGIKLGGKSPPEIALSIIAQLILKTYNK